MPKEVRKRICLFAAIQPIRTLTQRKLVKFTQKRKETLRRGREPAIAEGRKKTNSKKRGLFDDRTKNLEQVRE